MSLRASPRVAALLGIGLAVVLALVALPPFDGESQELDQNPSLWEFILSDRLTLGFIRLAFWMLGLYLAASIPALIAQGRWLKGFGSSGLTADDAEQADETLEDLKREVALLEIERDDALDLAEARGKDTDELLEELDGLRQQQP